MAIWGQQSFKLLCALVALIIICCVTLAILMGITQDVVKQQSYRICVPYSENQTSSQSSMSPDQDRRGQLGQGALPSMIYPPTTPLAFAEIEKRFNLRRETLENACLLYGNSSMFRKKKSDFFYVAHLNTVYCPIQKCSSTTWKEIFSAIEAASKEQVQIVPSKNFKGKRNVTMFLFVREPFSRLLSAYVDKLFSPNLLYWHRLGVYIVSNFRRNASPKSLSCGHDVTFSEYIKYFIHSQITGMHREGHFIPTHDHCRFCEHPYNYVGHLETLEEDMSYILKKINSPVNFTKNFDNNTIINNSLLVLDKMRDRLHYCMDLEEACRRLWRKWQIRGIISKSISIPLRSNELQNISLIDFQASALQAVAQSEAKEVRRLQKKEALAEAFAYIPLTDRLTLQKLLFLDFKLFGFDPAPTEIFPTTPHKKDDYFSYFSV